MKLITYYEELILLNGMEGRDKELTSSLSECRQNKANILKEISEIQKRLRDKKGEIEEIKEKEDDLMKKFHELCPDGSPFYDEILLFFKKIIKRKRRVERAERAEGEEEEEDMYDEEEDFEEDEEEEDNEASYKFNQEEHKIDDIEKLRDERLDLFEEKQKIEAFINELENQRKKLDLNENRIKQELERTEDEI